MAAITFMQSSVSLISMSQTDIRKKPVEKQKKKLKIGEEVYGL